jgi:hypothetical protein
VATLAQALGVPVGDVDVNDLLGLAGEAAHAVERPAAPLTTFLVGYAAGLRGGGPGEVTSAGMQARAAVTAWDRDTHEPGATAH